MKVKPLKDQFSLSIDLRYTTPCVSTRPKASPSEPQFKVQRPYHESKCERYEGVMEHSLFMSIQQPHKPEESRNRQSSCNKVLEFTSKHDT